MTSSLTITEFSAEDLTILRLGGRLDLSGTTALLGAVAGVTGAGHRAVICDLRDLQDTPQQHLLMVFPAAQRRLGAWFNHELFLTGVSPFLKRTLVNLGVDRYVTVEDTLPDALAAGRERLATDYHHLELTAERSSPAQARAYLRDLPKEPTAPWRDAAQVIVSELTSNVVRHVGGPFAVDVAVGRTQLLLGVTDASRQEPILRPPRTGALSGRGVQLVHALSDSWGVRLVHDGGKTVWAKITPDAA